MRVLEGVFLHGPPPRRGVARDLEPVASVPHRRDTRARCARQREGRLRGQQTEALARAVPGAHCFQRRAERVRAGQKGGACSGRHGRDARVCVSLRSATRAAGSAECPPASRSARGGIADAAPRVLGEQVAVAATQRAKARELLLHSVSGRDSGAGVAVGVAAGSGRAEAGGSVASGEMWRRAVHGGYSACRGGDGVVDDGAGAVPARGGTRGAWTRRSRWAPCSVSGEGAAQGRARHGGV